METKNTSRRSYETIDEEKQRMKKELKAGSVIGGHTKRVLPISCGAPDSNFIVSGSENRTIKMWDARTKQLVHTFEAAHSEAVLSVAVAPDSNFIVSG